MFTTIDDARVHIDETFDKLNVRVKCDLVVNTRASSAIACAKKVYVPGGPQYSIIFYPRAVNYLEFPERDFREVCVHEAVHISTAYLHNQMGHDAMFHHYMRICGFKNPQITMKTIGGPDSYCYRCKCGAVLTLSKRIYTAMAAGQKRYCKKCGNYLTITNKEDLVVIPPSNNLFSLVKEFDLSLIGG